MIFKITDIAAHARGRGPQFIAAVKAAAEKHGNELHISSEEWNRISKLYRAESVSVALPGPADVLGNFASAVGRWASAGFPVVKEQEYRARTATCKACPLWKADALVGLGKCEACGCTKAKLWLKTESCPLGKWGEQTNTKTMNITQLSARKEAVEKRVAQLGEQIALAENRLKMLRQQHQIAIGSHQTLSQIITEESVAMPINPAPYPPPPAGDGRH